MPVYGINQSTLKSEQSLTQFLIELNCKIMEVVNHPIYLNAYQLCVNLKKSIEVNLFMAGYIFYISFRYLVCLHEY